MLRRFTFDRFVGALFLISIGVAACLMPAQSDTWWHLRSGEQIWLSGGVQLHDTFSYTVNGAYWPNQEWLSEVVFYLLYRAGGLPLLTAATAAAVVAAWGIVWKLTPGGVRSRVVLCVGAAIASAPEWSVRPKVFTLLLVAVTAFLLSRRRYLWLPPLVFIWANLHGGVVIGLLMVCAALVVESLQARRLLETQALAVGWCFLAASLTPLGLAFWTEIPASISRIRQYGIDEWSAPRLTDPIMAPFWLIAAALLVGILLSRWRSGDARHNVLLWCALTLLPSALVAQRNVSIALLVATPAVGEIIRSRISQRTWDPSASRQALNVALLGAALAAAVLAVSYGWRQAIPRLEWNPVPHDALEALGACPGNLYNRYDDGGYVIWFAPTRKVFIDGRQDPYPVDMMLEHMRVERSGDYQRTFERYSIGCAFLPPESMVARRLEADGWTTSYADSRWVVLSRPASSVAALALR